jgi:hypothetical protein
MLGDRLIRSPDSLAVARKQVSGTGMMPLMKSNENAGLGADARQWPSQRPWDVQRLELLPRPRPAGCTVTGPPFLTTHDIICPTSYSCHHPPKPGLTFLLSYSLLQPGRLRGCGARHQNLSVHLNTTQVTNYFRLPNGYYNNLQRAT